MSKRLHTILNEKYRPDTLEGYICKDEYKNKFQEFIQNQDIPHLLFAGKPGAGKTTIAKILVENIDCDYLYINATDERSMDVMRDKVGSFAAAGSFKNKAAEKGNKVQQASVIGKEVAEKALKAGIETVVFDRNGYLYHGRVKSVADAAREGGLKF